MGTSTNGLTGVTVTSHAAEGYTGEIERALVRSMAVLTVRGRGTKARLVTLTIVQVPARRVAARELNSNMRFGISKCLHRAKSIG